MTVNHGAVYEREYQEEGDTFWIVCLDEPGQKSGPGLPVPNGLVAGRVPGIVLDEWVARAPCHWCGSPLGDVATQNLFLRVEHSVQVETHRRRMILVLVSCEELEGVA
jgi:hypothetical protein